MALLPLHFDTVSKRFVFSETDPCTFKLPDLHEEDGLTIAFRALKRISQVQAPFFERVTLTGWALKVSIGSAASILASNDTWAATDADTLLSGTLDLNVAGITALPDGTSKVFEVRLFDGTDYYRGQQDVTIHKAVATIGAVNPVVNDTALGKREAKRTYVQRELAPGDGVVWVSQDGLKKVIQYLHNDGSMRQEELT